MRIAPQFTGSSRSSYWPVTLWVVLIAAITAFLKRIASDAATSEKRHGPGHPRVPAQRAASKGIKGGSASIGSLEPLGRSIDPALNAASAAEKPIEKRATALLVPASSRVADQRLPDDLITKSKHSLPRRRR